MKAITLSVCMLAAVFLLSACGSETGSEPADAPAVDAAATDAADPITGTWSGSWGPTPEHRNDVTLDLSWDGTSLTGTVNPGPNAIELGNTSFDPATGDVTMEADAESFRGPVHYMIQGQLEGNTMTGSWTHEGGEGDFTISMD